MQTQCKLVYILITYRCKNLQLQWRKFAEEKTKFDQAVTLQKAMKIIKSYQHLLDQYHAKYVHTVHYMYCTRYYCTSNLHFYY